MRTIGFIMVEVGGAMTLINVGIGNSPFSPLGLVGDGIMIVAIGISYGGHGKLKLGINKYNQLICNKNI